MALTRAMRSLRRQLQWTRIRYAAPKAELWSGLASLYLAVASGNVDAEMLIYPGETTTIKREFLKALMQPALSCEALQPRGQDIASAIVSYFASSFVLSMKPESGCTHWFDPKHPGAPVRATRELPPGLAFDGPADPAFVISILDHVHRDWSGNTQARSQERQKVNARITVVPGFKGIMRALEFAVSDSLDFTDQPTAESWVVDDASERGYGAVIRAVAGDWVEVGSLVGVEGDVPRAWRVGVIRRVRRLEGKQQHVGVELLGRNAILVRMRRETERQAQMGVSQRMPLDFAILLSADVVTVQPEAEVEVLVRSGSFTSMD